MMQTLLNDSLLKKKSELERKHVSIGQLSRFDVENNAAASCHRGFALLNHC